MTQEIPQRSHSDSSAELGLKHTTLRSAEQLAQNLSSLRLLKSLRRYLATKGSMREITVLFYLASLFFQPFAIQAAISNV